MTWAIRSTALAVGAAALLSAQAAYAAPVAPRSAHVDPLVALSALATVQSNAAVCSASTAAAAGAAAAQAATPGCVLPVTGAPAPVAEVGPPPPPPPVVGAAAAPKAFGVLPLVIGLAAIIGLAAALLSGGGNGKGDLTPVSPA